MTHFGFEYFCGANTIVEIEDFPILEAAGIAFQINESKRPIYGYSSQHFDAVARGQIIVQGSLLINYVHQDYLFRAIESGLQTKGLLLTPPTVSGSDITNSLDDPKELNDFASAALSNYGNNVDVVNALKEKFWATPIQDTTVFLPNPHDAFGGLDIKITFGERSVQNQFMGYTGLLITSAYFTGRGSSIEIDENVIVEEYPFFARNIVGLRQRFSIEEVPSDFNRLDPTLETLTVTKTI